MSSFGTYENIDEYIDQVNRFMLYNQAWWDDERLLSLKEQERVVQGEIESYQDYSDEGKSLRYFNTVKRKLSSLYQSTSTLIFNILEPDELAKMFKATPESEEHSLIIKKAIEQADHIGGFLNFLVMDALGDPKKHANVGDLIAKSSGKELLRMRFNIVNAELKNLLSIVDNCILDASPQLAGDSAEPIYIWNPKAQKNHLLELIHELESKEWFLANPAYKGSVTFDAKAKAITALIGGVPWKTLSDYLQTANKDKATRKENPLQNLPKVRKFENIKPFQDAGNGSSE